jgi:RNA polymerase sigma-70 factor (sigma-E family)
VTPDGEEPEPTFEQFARAQLPRLLRYATMLTGKPELAQDLVQDVLVKVHRNWARVAAANASQRYVTRMVTHEYLSWRRRWAVRHIFATADVGDLADLGDIASVEDHPSRLATHDDLWRRLAGLPRQQRAVLVLRYYEGLPDAEIADVLGCSTTTVRGYAYRALATLRVDLTDRTAREPDALAEEYR